MPSKRWFVVRAGRTSAPSSSSGPAIRFDHGLEQYLVDGRLHRVDGPAVYTPGGTRLYYWRGVHVPAAVIERPRSKSALEILKVPNAEVRRCWMESYGLEDFLLDLARVGKAEILDEEPEPAPRRLWRIKAVKDEDEEHPMYVQVRCPSTGRWYFLRVDPTAYGGLKTCQAAVASTWRKPDGTLRFEDPSQYAPEVET